MKLPNFEKALIEQSKVSDYLLFDSNSGGKAEFFRKFGFSVAHWEILRDALLQHAMMNSVSHISETRYGTKIMIEGQMPTPDGRSPEVRTV